MAEEDSNVEVDPDIIERLVVSPDSDEVMSGFASPHSLALDFPFLPRSACVLFVVRSDCLPMDESVRDESSIQITPKEAKNMLRQ